MLWPFSETSNLGYWDHRGVRVLRPIASSLVLPIALLFACAHKPPVPAPIGPVPSPLIESTRAHGRVAERPLTGRTITIDAGLPKPVSLYIPQSSEAAADVDLVIHFHGSSFLPFQAVETLSRPTIAVAVVLGSGSARYEQPFRPPEVFPHLIEMVESASGKHVKRIYLTSFSAGYGGRARGSQKWIRQDRRHPPARFVAHRISARSKAPGVRRRDRKRET